MYVTGDLGPLTFYTSQRAKLVAFPRASPLHPPTAAQESIREYFRTCAAAWRALNQQQRIDWQTAAKRCNLRITGYNLFTWYYRCRDTSELATIQRQSGITLAHP
jgi:hypothetical protein